MIKNAYFTSEALFVLKIFKFLSLLYDVTAWLTKIVIHILPNISRSKGNQTMKFGQLIEYNMRNIFLEKSYTKCGRETILRPFSKKLKLNVSLDQYSKVLYILF